MKEQLKKTYNPTEIENRLYKFWIKNDFFSSKVQKNKSTIQF